ncbi:cinnamoyl- reductase-like SNL6 isoform X2 [Olea europaea subsp. europaea]|uniref:Cinnamoyl- reductase-like SNL6 isoform X2 n=1 Tax=Olea europaea subsp. europaea TaxID=158383 RepID=A0A8S0SDU3_OLEEU|nr:cinnamoyl- reductase-like SNL6 isoform X2 [Olea europaea subsp. europaea]
MGILRLHETDNAEIEEFRRMLLSCAAGHRRKDGDDLRDNVPVISGAGNEDVLEKLVCVTSGVSYLGIAIVNQLLVRGYSVRIIVDNEDVEKLRQMEISGEMRLTNSIIEIVMAKLNEIESLANAFDGCRGVFHTAGFIDPAGLSGYSKAMAEIEVSASKNVVKACGVTPSVRHCVLTSSLLTCIWRDNSCNGLPSVIDHSCWSDESVCQNKKLWYALGKLRAEKSAWKVAKESGVKLATVCPGLITGPDFYHRSPTSTIAYLKGVQEMYVNGLLASVDVNRLAEAHVCVFEGMKKTASGRYICFDRIIGSGDEIENLARETGINSSTIIGGASSSNRARFELSNQKLFRLMSRTWRCFNE